MSKLFITEIATLFCATGIASYLLWRNRQNIIHSNFPWFIAIAGIAFSIIAIERTKFDTKLSPPQMAMLLSACTISLISLSYLIASSLQKRNIADLILKLAATASYFGFVFFIHLTISGHKIKNELNPIFSNKLLNVLFAASFFALFTIFAKHCQCNNSLISTALFIPFRFPALFAIVYGIKWIIYQCSEENNEQPPEFNLREYFPGNLGECIISASQWTMIICLQLRSFYPKLKDLSHQLLAAMIDGLQKLAPASEYLKDLASSNPFSSTSLLDKSKIFLPALNNMLISICLFQCVKKFASTGNPDNYEETVLSGGEIVLLILTSIAIASEIGINNLSI